MEYKIEKGLPIPRIGSGGRRCLYPFASMEVGDSFAVPLSGECRKTRNGEYAADKRTMSVLNSARVQGIKLGAKFTVRTLKDENIVRVWRVK